MGKNSGGGGGGGRGRGRKNKARMNYLKEVKRQGGGEGGQQQGSGGGYKTGDYVSAYGYHSRGRGGRGRGWGGGGRGGGGGGGGRKPRSQLTGGMKGFMLTTNFRESDCVREAYNLLNEYDNTKEQEEGQEVKEGGGGEGDDDKVVEMDDSSAPGADAEKQEKMDSTGGGGGERNTEDAEKEKDDDDDEDIAEALQKEMKNLKSERVTKRFTCVDTGVKNVVFINTTVDDPTEIMYRIFDDVLENRESKSRHILRFMPIEATCKMDLETVKEVSKGIFQKYFKDGYKSFKIVANVRYNSSISKDEIIKTVAEAVDAVSPLNFVDLKNGTYTIVAEVLKGVVCLGVLRDFMKYKKFNIAEAAAPDKPPGDVKNSEESGDKGCVENAKGGPESGVDDKALPESAGDGEKELLDSVGDKGMKVSETEEADDSKKQSDNAAEEEEEEMIIADEDKVDKETGDKDQSVVTSPTATETPTVDQEQE